MQTHPFPPQPPNNLPCSSPTTSTIMLEHSIPSSQTQSSPPPSARVTQPVPCHPHLRIMRWAARWGWGDISPAPAARGQGSGVWSKRHLTGLQPRKGGGVGCGVGEGWGREWDTGTLRGWRREEGLGIRAGGREEGRGAENEGSIPDASLWTPSASSRSRSNLLGREAGLEDPALQSRPSLKTNELPALLFTSHRCGRGSQ